MPEFSNYVESLDTAAATTGTILIPVSRNGDAEKMTPAQIVEAGGAGGGTVTSVAGTTNRVTSSGGATPVINIDAAYDAAITAEIAAAVAPRQLLVNSATALTDASSMALTAIKHTLTTSSATRTFTISYTGDDISIRVVLNTTSSVFTFPAGALCVNSDGSASGDNTCSLAGVSGDVYVFAIKHWGSSVYTVVCKNTLQ